MVHGIPYILIYKKVDIKTLFLHGKFKESIYIDVLKGFCDSTKHTKKFSMQDCTPSPILIVKSLKLGK
uniref:Reverse transcriptase Ty1/copia-type domain-containing protein n=1 Tax=Physcomitrium patens TaxID=3218 RepID=A0A2K1K793_PHYPA|nr:hypothetical protein PHYPA_011546 [Physcomitrium patens]